MFLSKKPRKLGSETPPPQWVASQLHLCPMLQHFLWTQELSDLGPGALTGLHQGRVTPDQPLISGAMTHMQSEQKASILKKKGGGRLATILVNPIHINPGGSQLCHFGVSHFQLRENLSYHLRPSSNYFPLEAFAPRGKKKSVALLCFQALLPNTW